jgi:hypothetical protein
MSYLTTNGKMNDLEHKIYSLKREREILMNKIESSDCEKLTRKDLDYIIDNVISEIKTQNTIQNTNKINKQNTIQNTIQNTNKINKQISFQQPNTIKELYPVPIIPGGEYLKRGVISMRNVDFPYQDLTTTYQRVGTVATVDKTDDYMMTLYRRDIAPERDLYEYKVIDHTNGNNIEIFLNTNIALLRNGDKIIIQGYESKGEFIVNLDRQYSYIRLRPFP